MKVASVSHSVIALTQVSSSAAPAPHSSAEKTQRLRVGELALGGGAPGGARHAAVDLLLHQAVERGGGGGHQPDARGGGQRGHQRRPAGHGQEHADHRAEHDQLHDARLGERVVLAPARRLAPMAGEGRGTGTELMTRGLGFLDSGRRPLRSRCRSPAPRRRQCAPARPAAASRARRCDRPVANWSTTRPPMMTAAAARRRPAPPKPCDEPAHRGDEHDREQPVRPLDRHQRGHRDRRAVGAPAQLAREREAFATSSSPATTGRCIAESRCRPARRSWC